LRLINVTSDMLYIWKKLLVKRLNQANKINNPRLKEHYTLKNQWMDAVIFKKEREEFNKKKLYLGKIVFEYNSVYLDKILIVSFFRPIMINQLSTRVDEKRFKDMLSMFSINRDIPTFITIFIFMLGMLIVAANFVRNSLFTYKNVNFYTKFISLVVTGHIDFI